MNLPAAIPSLNVAGSSLGNNKIPGGYCIEFLVDKKIQEMEQKILRNVEIRFNQLELKMQQNHSELIQLLIEIKNK